VSQFISNQPLAHKKKYLGELYDFPSETMAVGRLDEPSEGLLILTTDGSLSERIRSRLVEKAYWVQVDGLIDQTAIDQLQRGVQIKVEGKLHLSKLKVTQIEKPAKLPIRAKPIRDERHGPTTWLSVVLNEGKFRQIRKTTAAVGLPSLRLIRNRIGSITLSQLGEAICTEVEGDFIKNQLLC